MKKDPECRQSVSLYYQNILRDNLFFYIAIKANCSLLVLR